MRFWLLQNLKEFKKKSLPWAAPWIVTQINPLSQIHQSPPALLSELSLFNYFSPPFLISSHHWKYQWWWEWRGANALLIALPPLHPPSSNHISINNSQPGIASRCASKMIGLSVRAAREHLQFVTSFPLFSKITHSCLYLVIVFSLSCSSHLPLHPGIFILKKIIPHSSIYSFFPW